MHWFLFAFFKNSIRRNSHFESIINSSIEQFEFLRSIYSSLFIYFHCVFFFLFAFTFPSLSFNFLRFSFFFFVFPFPISVPSQYLHISISPYLLQYILQYPLINETSHFTLLTVKAVLPEKNRFPLFINFLIRFIVLLLFCRFFFFNWHKHTVGLFISSWIFSSILNFTLRFVIFYRLLSFALWSLGLVRCLSVLYILCFCSYGYELIILLVIRVACGRLQDGGGRLLILQ